jgi:ubiquinone/menaquinone biosynthesis C-methylase UbiE
VRVRDEEIRTEFADRYGRAQTDATRAIERTVIGGDWGANGFTTIDEADELARSLRLRPGARLLDLGAGRGWPSLYLAARTGCAAVLLDPPIEGLVAAVARAEREDLADRAPAVVASARSLPLARASFDAVVHTDVLCCLRPKQAALRACWRVLRPGGRTAFCVIHLSPGLGARDRRRARRDGPMAVATTSTYPSMLASAGFVDVIATDRTEEFARVAAAWIEQRELHRDALEALLGKELLEQRQASATATLQAVRDGLLRRSMLEAVRP